MHHLCMIWFIREFVLEEYGRDGESSEDLGKAGKRGAVGW